MPYRTGSFHLEGKDRSSLGQVPRSSFAATYLQRPCEDMWDRDKDPVKLSLPCDLGITERFFGSANPRNDRNSRFASQKPLIILCS